MNVISEARIDLAQKNDSVNESSRINLLYSLLVGNHICNETKACSYLPRMMNNDFRAFDSRQTTSEIFRWLIFLNLS